jgi:tetratricopeptide (TPR) repeat protein/heme exporter protein D
MSVGLQDLADARVEARRALLPLGRALFYLLCAVALVYALLAGLKTIAEFDLGWQMAIARWAVQHHQIPSVDVLSYTAAGQPWIYPIGAGLIFYGLFVLGGYAALSWLAAVACVGIVAILVRRGSAVTAALAILAVPLITSRTTPRAEMFTMVLFAAFLSLLWQEHETGAARLWLLPILMAAWVNLHPGFIAGLGLLGAYVMVEALDMLQPGLRSSAAGRLRRAWPWLAATLVATLLNPWGWNVFRVIARQEAAMGAHSQLILEWAPIPMNWTHIRNGLSLRDPDEFYLLLLFVILALAIAVLRRQIGAGILLCGATYFPIRHMRFTGLFSIVAVMIGGAVLTPVVYALKDKIAGRRVRRFVPLAVGLPLLGLAAMRATNVVTERTYLSETNLVSGSNLVSFGAGQSWWFPERAAAFVERENLPGQIFSTNNEGGFMAFRLGPKYKDYIDGRAIPFGTELTLRTLKLKVSAPDSPEWSQEAERYNINVILLPIGRFIALQFFPVLKQFCESDRWRPVYLDEVSVVFLRQRPETEALIKRLQIDCSTTPLPAVTPAAKGTKAFNQWANAASVLRALGRSEQALTAANKALAIVPESGYLYFLRGHIFQESGRLQEAQEDYLLATELEPNLVAPWSAMADFYQETGRLPAAIDAWEHAAGVSRWPWEPLVNLGYADLQAHRPREALAAFDAAAKSLPAHSDLAVDNNFLANIAHGRARSWYYLGDLRRAISFEEQAARLLPDADVYRQLADLYDRAGHTEDANRIRAQAMTFSGGR